MSLTVQDLAQAVIDELNRLRATVDQLPLSSLGKERIKVAIQTLDERTAIILTNHQTYKVDVRDDLARVLETAQSILPGVQSAIDCEWVGSWLQDCLDMHPQAKALGVQVVRSPSC